MYLPILRQTSQKRQYITYPETEEVIVTDSGTINKINLRNASKENVFVRSGTIFQGKGTQNRVLTRSAVLFPKQEVSLDCRCVHASHGIRSGSGFEYGGVTPLAVDSAFYTAGYTPSDQHTMWRSVETVSATMCSAGPTNFTGFVDTTPPSAPRAPRNFRHAPGANVPYRSRSLGASGVRNVRDDAAEFIEDFAEPIAGGINMGGQPFIAQDDLKKNFDQFAANFDDILSKARLHDNQVGLALITDKGCKTIELYDVDASWESLHKDSVKRMGTELLRGPDNTNVFEYKPENAINAVRAVLALPFKNNLIYEHKPGNGEPHVAIYGVTANRFVGEVVELDSRVVHAVILEIN